MCFRFLKRLKELCGCCWLAVWNFIVYIFCCLCCKQQRREEKTTDDEKKDKDLKSGPAKSNGSKHSEPQVKEPNSAKSEDKDKDSNSDLTDLNGSKHAKHEVKEPNPAKSEQEDKDLKSGPAKSNGSKHSEPQVKEPNSAKSEDKDKDSNSDLTDLNGSKDAKHEVKEPNPAKSEQEDKDLKSGPAKSSGSKHSEPQVKEPNSAKSEDKEKATFPSDNTECNDLIQVLTPLPSGFTDTFFEHFENKLQKIGFKANLIDMNTFNTHATFNDVVLVICHNHSRLEDNVKNAVSKLHVELFERIFLIVLHAWNMNSYEKPPSKLVFEDHSLFKRFYNIVDIAFSTTAGIQEFERNTQNAFQALQSLKGTLAV